MELKELVNKTTQLFSCKSAEELGQALMVCVEKNDYKKNARVFRTCRKRFDKRLVANDISILLRR